MYEEDIDLVTAFHINAGHSKSSIKTYDVALKKYSTFHNMSLKELINEAIYEQENHVSENNLKLYNRIMAFRQYLIDNHIGNTITTTLTKIKTFYQYNRIRLPFIPPLNTKSIKKNSCISYDDLLTKEEIRNAMGIADDNLKMWIYVMLSSGSSRIEAKSLTNEIFYKGTMDYHRKDNFKDALEFLAKSDNCICTCEVIRQKTDKPYYTFLTPEAVQFIAKTKLKNNDFILSDFLLKYSPDHIGCKFRFINDYLELGSIGGYRRFRPHMLRKFHATHLNQGSTDKKELLDMESVDNLQGRGKDLTRETYFKNNPRNLKLNYIRCMSNVSLYHRYTYKIRNGEIRIYSQKIY